jgi:hypothetical protein
MLPIGRPAMLFQWETGWMSKQMQVDSVVPRAKALVHAVLPGVAFLLGAPLAPWLLAFTGAVMAISVLGGPQYSLFGRLFKAIRPALHIKPGHPEMVAPHRFAEAIGAGMLLAAAAFYFAGAESIGAVLALIVVALAALNAAAGICVGCQMYLLLKRGQGRLST